MSSGVWNNTSVTIGAASALALLAVILSVIVIVRRVTLKIEAGDIEQPLMSQAICTHANLAEPAPLEIVNLEGAEARSGSTLGVIISAALARGPLLLEGRFAHPVLGRDQRFGNKTLEGEIAC